MPGALAVNRAAKWPFNRLKMRGGRDEKSRTGKNQRGKITDRTGRTVAPGPARPPETKQSERRKKASPGRSEARRGLAGNLHPMEAGNDYHVPAAATPPIQAYLLCAPPPVARR